MRLILGHESLGRVREAPPDCGLTPGDHVVGIVRHPDPVPCAACAGGQWDMCRNGLYTEHGIKQRNGFGAERWRIEPEFAVKVDPALGDLAVLLEPASVVAKAWDHADRLWRLADAPPRRVLITGAGPIGLLAALIGAQRYFDVHVYDHNEWSQTSAQKGSRRNVPLRLGELSVKPDILMECSGAPSVVRDVLGRTAPGGIVCLIGVTAPGHDFDIDVGELNRTMVLDNDTVFGTVNANRRHYELAGEALQRADKAWLNRLITRREPFDRWKQSLERQPDDIKVIVDFS